ncbi:hypothetical protein [Sedimenticola thiotaurini]|uniref:Crp/Fnr family transcriptional regulator n=1 Tax=Sedimenticola thiotaurini TaxID=1543721 RepID=A0A0F7JZA1_9GAMM|nr:hypothetical protein [Sedimenticola thiotaurini]AKH20200.1 hypothetical protein AAY24_07365 [Sedimenticola thiotaurini]
MLLPTQNLSDEKRKLLKLYSALSEQDKLSLLAFAEFLLQRSVPDAEENKPTQLPEPKPIPRPEGESVVGAIKRLSESYHMLERSALLTETSSLMTAHVMHGRSAAEVIDELEALFKRHYEELVSTLREQ